MATLVDQKCINTIRFLAVDAIEKARSGHPGMPLGAAPMAYTVWDRFLNHNPENPRWFDRDRFVLSAGHGSGLLYALLHLYGYDVSLDDIKNFRQWQSKTPGHPEYGLTPGVEVTTGPLGQGFAMGVGMAIAERRLAALFNPPGEDASRMVDHFTYAIVSDGDLMEGVASEAASLAGHLGLGKLIYLYDDNQITIDGDTGLSFTEDVGARFSAYGWQVQTVEDGNDIDGIESAIHNAKQDQSRPSLIRVKTHIGYGSPKQDSSSAHGEPLGKEACLETKKKLGWPAEPSFLVPEDAAEHFSAAVTRGRDLEAEWTKRLSICRERHPEKSAEFERAVRGGLPDGWERALPVFGADTGAMATRAASGKVLGALAKVIPGLIGGSADLAPSNKTFLSDYSVFSSEDAAGRNFHFGVREHAMAALVNGMAVHGGMIPYGGTFLVFSDYMRPSLRLAALMQSPSIFVFTHDSLAVGEDGPTHQPVEHIMSLRLIPGFTVIRPADANETAAAWSLAIQSRGPVALVLTRQNVPVLDPGLYDSAAGTARGAYVLSDPKKGRAGVILVASGSEVSLALDASRILGKKGVDARVVSMPSWELFAEQPRDYREDVLPADIPKLAIEAGSTSGWRDHVGDDGDVVGLDRFGASAPGPVAMKNLGFDVDRVVDKAWDLVYKKR